MKVRFYERTDVKRFTPETQMSWVTRFPPRINQAVVVDDEGVKERLDKPCFTSLMRKRNTGNERKC